MYNKFSGFPGRLDQVLRFFEENPNKLATNKLGKSKKLKTKIYSILNKKSNQNPSMKTIIGILNVCPTIEYRWLLTGEGDMLVEERLRLITPATDIRSFYALLDKSHEEDQEDNWEQYRRALIDSYADALNIKDLMLQTFKETIKGVDSVHKEVQTLEAEAKKVRDLEAELTKLKAKIKLSTGDFTKQIGK